MHQIAVLMEDIARASISAVVTLFMATVAVAIGIIILVVIMTVLKMVIADISAFLKKISGRRKYQGEENEQSNFDGTINKGPGNKVFKWAGADSRGQIYTCG